MRGLLIGWLSLACVASAAAHDTQIVQCDRNLKIEAVTKLGERLNENGTVSEFYDRNGDGELDIEALSHQHTPDDDGAGTRIPHSRSPFLYIVDLDFDGEPDAVYVDVGGVGRCDDIHLYKDLTIPRRPSPDEREHGGAALPPHRGVQPGIERVKADGVETIVVV